MFSKFHKNISNYDLRLDQACIFISTEHRGEQSVTGRFAFRLSQDTSIKRIKVRVFGSLKVPRDGFMTSNDRERITFERNQALAASKTLSSFTLPAGEYDFPFRILLASDTAETITGVNHEYHSYKVQGIIERHFGKDFVIARPLRVYRLSELETDHSWPGYSESIENLDENIHYNISIPDRNIPFGSTFPVEFWLTPLSKHTKPVALAIEVLERHDLRIEATATESVRSNIHFLTSKKTHILFDERHDLTAESYEMPTPDCVEVQRYLERDVRLPQTLNACSQTVQSKPVKIDHVLTTTLEMQTPDGHISTITETFPLKIFMSPQVIAEDGTVHSQKFQRYQDKNTPPPPYGAHISDSAIQETLEGPGDNDRESQMATGVNPGLPPHEPASGCQLLANLPTYERVVCMVT